MPDVTVTPSTVSVTVSGRPPLANAESAGLTSTQWNYVFNNAVNTIENASDDARVWGNSILGGGNSVFPNRMYGYTSLRTIAGGYNNIIGTAGSTDENECINSQILAGSHGRIVSFLSNRVRKVSHGTIVGGAFNEIRNGDFGAIVGGRNNLIEEKEAFFTAGEFADVADGFCAFIGGGYGNSVNGYEGVVCGGRSNIVECKNSSIVGGASNAIAGAHNFVNELPVNSYQRGFIGGGYQNSMTSSSSSSIVGGEGNTMNESPAGELDGAGSHFFIGGGKSNKIARSSTGFPLVTDCSYSSILGGWANIVNNYAGTVIGGTDNQVQATYAVSFGRDARARLAGALTQGGKKFSAVGDAQSSVLVLKAQTTSSASVVMLSHDASLAVPSDTTWAFRMLIVARNTNNAVAESAAYEVTGCVDNQGGTVALVGTPGVTVLAEDVAAWNVSVAVSGSNLEISCTGETSKTINWVGRLTLAEVTG